MSKRVTAQDGKPVFVEETMTVHVTKDRVLLVTGGGTFRMTREQAQRLAGLLTAAATSLTARDTESEEKR